ncbi:Flp family type IVb pilin [Xaviernesmea oryzae]|uniref:Flp family type IVb pilin n=1 Tax=Xaviernesmea oryzae TaxID=464029 RepID=UPI0008C27318|nr:Flp family type IVb pilin [Xaviernesmea oryzae]SEL94118.1 Flp pilus assembly protein, pilin Flp [Xaviernesmea oryzae]
MQGVLARLGRQRDGGTVIEYALIAGLIGLVLVGGLGAVSGELNNTFTKLADIQKAP